MKTIILYTSRHGSTEEYAKWIAEELNCNNVYDIKNFETVKLNEFDVVLLGSRTYMGNLAGLKFLTDNWEALKSKQVYFFAVGLIPSDAEASKLTYEKIPEEIRNSIQYIKLPGRVVFKKLNPLDKFITKVVMKKGSIDKVDRSAIKPIVDYVRTLEAR